MKKYLTLSALCLVILAPNAYACSQMPPEHGFIYQNDKNQDGKLTQKEWKSAKLDNYFVAFRLGNVQAFKRLDKDKDGFLDDKELSEKVRYDREPCADWEEAMQKMMSETTNNQ